LDTRSGITVTRIAGRVDSLDQEIEEMKKGLDALKRTVGVAPKAIARQQLTSHPNVTGRPGPNCAAARNDRFHPDILRSLIFLQTAPSGRGLVLSATTR
jgi:hypothetical protein